jgi:uncharacterized protein (DUF433 family)
MHDYTTGMLIVEPITHIKLDERGVAWIADTNVKVIEVAMDHAAYEWDADEIHAAHPHLSLAQIHAALSYYHDHKGSLDDQVKKQMEDYRRLRRESTGQLNRAALHARLKGKGRCSI